MATVSYGDHSISSSNTMEPKFANYCSKKKKKKKREENHYSMLQGVTYNLIKNK